MTGAEARRWWIGAGLVALIVVSSQLWPLPDASARLGRLTPVGVWHRAAPTEIFPWEKSFFGRAQVVKQLAVVQGKRVALTVIDGSHNRRAVHDPEFCFRGAGWTVETATDLALSHGRGRRLNLRKHEDRAEAVFWFSNGREAFAEPLRYWLGTTIRRLTFGGSGDEPVLVMLISLDDTPPDWTALIQRWPDLARL